MEKPTIQPSDWIEIGKRNSIGLAKNAVVCQVYEDRSYADLAAVYFSEMGKAMKENFFWQDGHWEFKIKGPNGLYADNHAHLSQYVSILRSRKHWV